MRLTYEPAPMRRGLLNSSTATAFPNSGGGPIATATKPATVDLDDPTTGNLLVIPCAGQYTDLMFFGTDAANEAGAVRLVLWRSVFDAPGGSSAQLWLPHHLSDLTVTLGAKTGAAATAILNTGFFADTLVAAAGGDTGRVTLYSNAADAFAVASVRTDGWELLAVYFDIDTAATLNCAYGSR